MCSCDITVGAKACRVSEPITSGGSNGTPRAAGTAACGSTHGPPPARRRRPRTRGHAGLARGRLPMVGFLFVLVAGLFAVFFVGGDLLERHFLPSISTALHHGLLTLRAVIVTGIVCAAVYGVMRHHDQRLADAAGQLSLLLESYKSGEPGAARYHNPNLVRCRDVLHCAKTNCPMFHVETDRCWQIMALADGRNGNAGPRVDIRRCHDCEVYRRSCPDKLTELGESFNNLMFLLEQEARQVERMQARMVEQEKMVAIGQMAAGIAHEVGNPLSSISSIVQMVKRSGKTAARPAQLDLIETHIRRISTIVRQLVNLTRPCKEKWEQTDITKCVEEAIQLVQFDRRARNIDVVFDLARSCPPMYALRGQLQQVVINLALNALDAMPGGGTLTARVKAVDGDAVISIEDTGRGIPATDARRVFEPFFTTKEPGKGAGMGLSLSYGIVRKHGGTIDFNSSRERGTRFVVRIPILLEPPEV
ncbi:MAG: sensor histidine kinase [Phycisphaerae bacterium]